MPLLGCRFATTEDLRSGAYRELNSTLNDIHVRLGLPDHTAVNRARYPWSAGMLDTPQFYAARLWEYPFAISTARLAPGMKVADIGCGTTAFTAYLKECASCEVTGVDPDLIPGDTGNLGHGVRSNFIERTGLRVIEGQLEAIPLEDESQDCVFCISVMEHVEIPVRNRGMQEIARILKPGGLAVLTVDVSMHFELVRPLDLVWESGLTMVEPVDLSWPEHRFGMFSTRGVEGVAADVFGMTLVKNDRPIETQYRNDGALVPTVSSSKVPGVRLKGSQGQAGVRRRVGALLRRMGMR